MEATPQPDSAPLDAAQLRAAFATFPSGVVAVCAQVAGAPSGMAVSSFVAVSLEPALVAFCVQHTSTTWPRLRVSPRLGINVLGEQHGLVARRLASRTEDRFAGLAVDQREHGELAIQDAPTFMSCSVTEEIPVGDHVLVVLRVHELTCAPREPLVFHASTFRLLQRQMS